MKTKKPYEIAYINKDLVEVNEGLEVHVVFKRKAFKKFVLVVCDRL